ncbi:dihydrodipicolinate synthase family protein [Corticibacterium sp. UT-5YL-CI-8]|nr:dihydrodipicolinate synthase family protein [Tianweitania sp. UT-5YL-CI-8]
MTFLSGLSAFPITPADASGRVDVVTLRQLVGRLASAGVDSIGLLGSTGIYMYLSRAERRRALEAALEEVAGRTPAIAGIGALRTDEAVRLAQDAKAIGAAAGLLSAASYLPLSEDEVFEHFSTVARESNLPIVIYDNPGTTHFQFTPDLVARLAKVPGIAAIKNPGWDPESTGKLLADQRAIVPPGFSIGCSSDWTATETMIAGADIWYSVLGGLLTDVCLRIVRAAQRGDAGEARRLNREIAPIWDLFRQYSSFRTVYALADLLGLCHVEPPRPILPLPEEAKHQIAAQLAKLTTQTHPAG